MNGKAMVSRLTETHTVFCYEVVQANLQVYVEA